MTKKRILTGHRPTGPRHIGHRAGPRPRPRHLGRGPGPDGAAALPGAGRSRPQPGRGPVLLKSIEGGIVMLTIVFHPP